MVQTCQYTDSIPAELLELTSLRQLLLVVDNRNILLGEISNLLVLDFP
jgi:hypothetical protein